MNHLSDEAAYADFCDAIRLVMLYGANWTMGMQTLKTVLITSMDEFEHMYHRQTSQVESASVCWCEATAGRPAARRQWTHS